MAKLDSGVAALAFEGFGFAYASNPEAPVVKDVDWAVDAGAFALLCGDTGSGKTTLLRLAHPTLAPAGTREGDVRLFGEDPAACDPAQAAALVGYVSQHPADQIVCDSVWHELAFGLENLGVGTDEMRLRVAEVAHFFGIESWLHAPTADLSGGQMQLLNLAAALVCRPRLLLLDEPTAQLDPVATEDFVSAVARVNRQAHITVVVATHDPHLFRPFADTELVLPSEPASSMPSRATAFFDSFGRVQTDKPASAQTAVSFDEAFFRYGRELPWVLRGFNLSVRPGTVHALVGGNGCGKSTVLLAAAGVCKPQRGSMTSAAVRQAFLPQDPKLLMVCDTVQDELDEWRADGRSSAEERDELVDLFGLDDVRGLHPFDVSGGQLQKVALAKLLLTKPDLLLLDEPTKGLDATARAQLVAVLDQARQAGMTIVVATHDLAFVEALADEVTLVFDGQDAATAPPSALFEGSVFLRPDPAASGALKEALR